MAGLAYLLPGQGAQAPGMGKAFYDTYTSSRDIYKRANTRLGYDLTALCFEGPAEELTKTEKCQPALFVTSFAAFAALTELAPSLKPVAAAGLSLGELTALAVADAFTFSDAIYLVQARADAMAECTAHHKGSMLAVMGLAGDALKALCDTSGAVVANYNTQEQVVLSGTIEAIETAERLAKDKGAKRAVRLDVAGAFHSPLMQPAADAFKQAVAKIAIRPPAIPVISNVTAQPVRDPEQIRELLVKQIVSPVLWEPSVRTLIHAGTTHTLEFPPARVLTGMVRKIDPAIKTVAVDEPKDFEKLSDVLNLRSPAT